MTSSLHFSTFRIRLALLGIVMLPTIVVTGQTVTDVQQVGEALNLPSKVCGITTVDGTLYCTTDELALRVDESHGTPSKVEPSRIASLKGVSYAVRNPKNGMLYYTDKFLFFKSRLRVLSDPAAKKGKATHPGGRDIAIEHPAISGDGRYMVFSSKANDSRGGKDLYISVSTPNGWSYPRNLDKLNTIGNETAPTMWGDYLIFCSDGHSDSYGGTDLYAVKISVRQTDGESTGSVPEISQGHLQHLPYPFNSEDDERCAIVKESRTYVVREGDSTSIGDMLYAYDCTPDVVSISGVVRDKRGHPQPRTQVLLYTDGIKTNETTTDGNGRYNASLRRDRTFDLAFSKVGYGNERRTIETRRTSDKDLIETHTEDVELFSFEPNQYIELQELFGDNASIELTKEGRAKLGPITGFLTANPGVPVQITVYCGLENDKEFNRILADRRAKSIGEYLHSQVPAAQNVTVTSGGAFDTSKKSIKLNDLTAIKLGVF